MQNRLIESNPADGLIKPQGTVGTCRSITPQERKALLKVCEDDRFMVYLLMYYLGLRPSEAMNAKGGDIFWKQGKAFLKVRGTKTINAVRTVPIPDVLMKRLTSKRKNQYLADHDGKKHTRTSYDRLTRRLYREMNLCM
jgi:integrase